MLQHSSVDSIPGQRGRRPPESTKSAGAKADPATDRAAKSEAAKKLSPRFLACAEGQSAADAAPMAGRHKEVGGCDALSGAVLVVLCVVPVSVSVGAAPLPPLGVRLAAQADDRVEQVEAPTPTSLTSVDLDSRLGEALLDDRVHLQDPQDNDETKHRVPRTFADGLRAHTLPHVPLADRARPCPFRLRAFAGRAPPAV